ncbi:hypothetical protein [Enterobacter phage vB_ExiM_F5M1E]|nr:hypothetical protein [Enterobacter phage vB_ExiM_F1M1E]UNA03234.1 hypothetical protein [Enterobacter phage vB_ExiM_F2M1E]UNA03554.1 hypothetical protein [Enterobacter phage vB_ExiM_F4M1E]UNA03875.1 hypothetical protein [Enterobacter phage vB_ExiM_F5M1E]UNA04195.1 hypothetical protein [Pantoea phage vB_PdiM_F5M2A]
MEKQNSSNSGRGAENKSLCCNKLSNLCGPGI